MTVQEQIENNIYTNTILVQIYEKRSLRPCELLLGEAHERLKRLRMFHAQPFNSFSCTYLKESTLGAEHAFRIKRATFSIKFSFLI